MKKVLTTATDTQRINTLNLYSTRILFGPHSDSDVIVASDANREALTLAKEASYEKGLANALLAEAILDLFLGQRRSVDTTLASLRLALPLLQKSKDWFAVANCYQTTGDFYHFTGNNNIAIIQFDSSVRLFQQLSDTISSAWAMVKKAHSYSDLGNYSASFKAFHDAQELTPPLDTILRGYALCQMGQLFVFANLPELAIECMNKIRAFYPDVTPDKKLPWLLSWASRVGGEAFLQLHEIDSAHNLAMFLNYPIEKQDPPYNLFYGHLYSAMGQYKKAITYFTSGFNVSQKNSYEIGHAMHSNGLAEAYLHLKDYSRALYYANEAIKVSRKMHSSVERKNALGILSKIYAATKNYTKAFHYDQLYKTLNDSLAPEEYKRKLSLIQIKDQLEIQKKEATLLSNTNQINQQQLKIQEAALKSRSLLLYIFMVVLVAGILVAVLVNRNIKLKRKKLELQQVVEQVNAQQKLAELEKEKGTLEMRALRAQMNPHFIFNCLSSINRFILINKIDEASDYLTKFSRLIRMALYNSEKSLITLESELEALRLYLDLERLRFKNAFDYSITFVNTIDSNGVYIPPLLIQPFAENAIWHGLMQRKGSGLLEIQISADHKILSCSVIDNGIGRDMAAAVKSRSAEKTKSMGVEITTGRLALLNKSRHEAAVFNIEDLVDDEGNSCGTKVMLSIPYKDIADVST